MAPVKPKVFTAGTNPFTKFDGAISFEEVTPEHASRPVQFHGYMRPWLGIYKKMTAEGGKPPLHFHRFQYEYFRIIKGNLTLEINGVPKNIAEGEEMCAEPYQHHAVYGTPGTENNEIEFVLSTTDVRGAKGSVDYTLDRSFFENWYGYQEDIFQRGEKMDIIQVLAMFDGGDTYFTLPWWVPLRCTVALVLGVVVGRWIGGMLGYAPFYPEWTSDWQAACDAMEKCWTQKRFAKRDAQEKAAIRFKKEL